MQQLINIAARRWFGLIGSATYCLGLLLAGASLTLSGCGGDTEMTQIKNENPTEKAKDSMDAYLKNMKSKKQGSAR